jgi:hypothetical protein
LFDYAVDRAAIARRSAPLKAVVSEARHLGASRTVHVCSPSEQATHCTRAAEDITPTRAGRGDRDARAAEDITPTRAGRGDRDARAARDRRPSRAPHPTGEVLTEHC